MFAAIKRLLGSRRSSGAESEVLGSWARSQGYALKRVKDGKGGGGFVVTTPEGWRVEWGASQRPYITGSELRFRCETGLPPDAQFMLLTRVLAQTLETDVFSRFTNAMQTQVDHTLPEEMRWLAMHQRIPLSASPVLSRRFALFTNAEALARDWIEGNMLAELDKASTTWWTDALLLVMTLNRGILTVRMSGSPLEATQLRMVGALFADAVRRCRELVPR